MSKLNIALIYRTVFPEANLMMAADYLHLEDFHGAELYFQSALEIQPDYSKANYRLALTYLLTGKIEAAQQRCEALKTNDPEAAAKLAGVIAQFTD